jgi:hypothetical protein
MINTILTHTVQNFDTWKAGFESEQARNIRAKHGVEILALYRGLQNPDEITVVGRVASPENLQAMFADPAQQEIMKNAGVIGQPTMLVVRPVETSAAVALAR